MYDLIVLGGGLAQQGLGLGGLAPGGLEHGQVG